MKLSKGFTRAVVGAHVERVRLFAPKADEVYVTGEILNGARRKAMTRDGDGVWTAVLGQLPPDVYSYAFNIDGVNTIDPRNPWVKLGSGGGLTSQVEVPADEPQYYDSRPVPHGLVEVHGGLLIPRRFEATSLRHLTDS